MAPRALDLDFEEQPASASQSLEDLRARAKSLGVSCAIGGRSGRTKEDIARDRAREFRKQGTWKERRNKAATFLQNEFLKRVSAARD